MSALEKLTEAARLIVAVRNCMMFHSIHDEQGVREVLDKHGITRTSNLHSDVQELAHKAYDSAQAGLDLL